MRYSIAATLLLLVATNAHADEWDSAVKKKPKSDEGSSSSSSSSSMGRGPFYVQGTVPLGLHFGISLDPGSNFAGWRPDIEFGAHFNGRHEGFVLGLRQAFIIMSAPGIGAATTQLRFGYDIAVPISDFELTVAPYGTFGLGYTLSSAAVFGPNAGINATGGIDLKFFFYEGLYAFARPFEMGFQCLHDVGRCGIVMVWGAGLGFAFPSPK